MLSTLAVLVENRAVRRRNDTLDAAVFTGGELHCLRSIQVVVSHNDDEDVEDRVDPWGVNDGGWFVCRSRVEGGRVGPLTEDLLQGSSRFQQVPGGRPLEAEDLRKCSITMTLILHRQSLSPSHPTPPSTHHDYCRQSHRVSTLHLRVPPRAGGTVAGHSTD